MLAQPDQIMQRLQGLQQQYELLQHQLNELEQVKESISATTQAKEGQETLIPLGAGVFVKGTITKSDKVLMNVGLQIVVEKDPKAAEKIVSGQIEQLRKIGEQIQGELGQLNQMAQMMQMQQGQQKTA